MKQYDIRGKFYYFNRADYSTSSERHCNVPLMLDEAHILRDLSAALQLHDRLTCCIRDMKKLLEEE